jgi:hypothetical protein
MHEHKFQREVLRLLRKIVRQGQPSQEPQLTASQLGDTMSIGSIAPGSSGQFAVVLNWPAGVTPPANYNPVFTPSSSDPDIAFAPATQDLSNGTIPLAQQFVASVPLSDTVDSTGEVGFSALGTDGVTVLESNVVDFTIPQAPPAEPTLVATQIG